MSKSRDRDSKLNSERTEHVLDSIERALTEEPDIPVEPASGIDSLPPHLRDPIALIERGRALLKDGIPHRPFRPPSDFGNELRMAARNGRPIPSEVRQLMDTQRAQSEIAAGHTPSLVLETSPGPITDPPGTSESRTSTAAMSPQSEQEIEELAAALVADCSVDGRVDLGSIATEHDITFSFGHYRDCFDGLLECKNSRFHIYVNLTTNKSATSPRARFSFAHELGHYFLDWHRCELDRGTPPHGSRADFESGNLAEREADMFAANLLLPTKSVRKTARVHIDAAEITRLSQHFCTSLSATAIRCARLNLASIIVMRWTTTTRAWCWSSKDFEQRTGNRAFRSLDRIPQDSATRQMLAETAERRDAVVTKGTTLATWFPTIHSGSSSDDILVEECISLGTHGALTILRPP